MCPKVVKMRTDFECGDESRTDFRYTLYLLRMGCSDDDIKKRLLNERKKWENHIGSRRLESYLQRTINKARSIVD